MIGKLKIFVSFIYILNNLFFTLFGRLYYTLKAPSYLQLCKKNREFRNCLSGKRCFILGNGPSLNKEDLSCLRDEIVLTVNQISRNKQYASFSPKFHFWIDNNFFKIDENNPEDIELLNVMKKIASNKDTICFYPVDKADYINAHNICSDKAHYLLSVLKMHDRYKLPARIDHFVPGFGTVVQQAIYAAIYMDVKEIYLLGCDSTGIESTIKAIKRQNNDTYSYDISENEKVRMEKMVRRSNMTSYAYSYYSSLQGYSDIYKYCKRNGVKLINCSAESVLDMLPKQKLEDVLKDKN